MRGGPLTAPVSSGQHDAGDLSSSHASIEVLSRPSCNSSLGVVRMVAKPHMHRYGRANTVPSISAVV